MVWLPLLLTTSGIEPARSDWLYCGEHSIQLLLSVWGCLSAAVGMQQYELGVVGLALTPGATAVQPVCCTSLIVRTQFEYRAVMSKFSSASSAVH
eukprot:COSAG04_NODE_21793_length_367_cov_0.936567_1_plen_95_part_01